MIGKRPQEVIRIIHTADIHLDACYSGAGMPAAMGNRRRQSLRDVFADIIKRAREWPADALLIAGDVFDLERVTRDTVAFLRLQFEAVAPVPVIIAPGNHDPFVRTSPYRTEMWPENVHIFREPEWQAVSLADDGPVVHGFAFDGVEPSANPFGKLSVEQDGAVHVAVAHGSEKNHQPPAKGLYAPFDAATAGCDGLAYLALGHFHDYLPLAQGAGTTLCYSGAPEGHGFGEVGPRHYLEIEIDAGRVNVTPVPSSRVEYQSYEVDCTRFESVQELVEHVRALLANSGNRPIVRIILKGFCAPAVSGELDAARDALGAECEFLSFDDRTVLAEEYDKLARGASSLAGFIKELNDEIADASDDARQRLLTRAREVGLAAYRGQDLEIHGVPGD